VYIAYLKMRLMVLISVEIFTSNFNKICEMFIGYIGKSIYELKKSKVYYGSTYP